MKLDFNIQDFIISGSTVPVLVADKILRHHILPMQEIRDKVGFPIWPSQHSGYRPHDYELRHNRTGSSEHCFVGKGAVDWTCDHHNLEILLNELLNSYYNRVCYYPNQHFIHCDDKGDHKKFYLCDDGVNWEYQNERG